MARTLYRTVSQRSAKFHVPSTVVEKSLGLGDMQSLGKTQKKIDELYITCRTLRKSYVSLQILSGITSQKNFDNINVVLLGSHVQRCEAVLHTHHKPSCD